MYSIQRLTDTYGEYDGYGVWEAATAVSLSEAKKQVEVADAITYHDAHIERLILAATQQATVRSGRQLLQTGYRFTFDAFPYGTGRIPLPFPPLVSVESIKYYDIDGVQQTLDAGEYRLLTAREPGEICLRYGKTWPDVYDEPDAVQVEYLAGVAALAEDLGPEEEWFRQAILLLVQAFWLRDHDQQYERIMRAADLILEAHRCGDDFVVYGGD